MHRASAESIAEKERRYELADFLALGSQLGNHSGDPTLVDDFHPVGRDLLADPAVLGRQPEPLPLQVGIEPALRLVVGVTNVVARGRLLPCHLTIHSHAS